MWRPDRETFAALVSSDDPNHAARWYGHSTGQYPTVAALVHGLSSDGLRLGREQQLEVIAMGVDTDRRYGQSHFVGTSTGREPQVHLVTPSLQVVGLIGKRPASTAPDHQAIGWGRAGDATSTTAARMLGRAWSARTAVDGPTTADFSREVLAGLPQDWAIPARGVSRWMSSGQVPPIVTSHEALTAVRTARRQLDRPRAVAVGQADPRPIGVPRRVVKPRAGGGCCPKRRRHSAAALVKLP